MNKFRGKYIVLILALFTGWTEGAGAQSVGKVITLPEALDIAYRQSLQSLEAKNLALVSYWNYKNFKAELLPSLTLEGTLPYLDRSLKNYQNDDGSFRFVRNNYLSEDLSLNISQNISLTGGTVSLQSSLMRIDQLGKRPVGTGYLSIPASLTLIQPIITFNSLRWSKKIEPIKYEESLKQFSVNVEGVFLQTINRYFDLLLSMVNRDIAEQNLKNSDELVKVAEAKRERGLISENDLQQLLLGKMNAQAELIQVRQDYQKKMFALSNFLGLEDNAELSPVIPGQYAELQVDFQRVYDLALSNNPFSENIKRRLLETDMAIAKAKAERGFKLDFYASVGYTGSSTDLWPSYQDLQDRQVASLGIRIPILDWGKGKSKVELAKSKQEVEKGRIEQEKNDFEQNIKILIRQINDQPIITRMFEQADSLARRRYETAYKMFVMGKITVLDINAAQNEQNAARRNYINQIYFSWLYNYKLRQVALFDFVQGRPIVHDPSIH